MKNDKYMRARDEIIQITIKAYKVKLQTENTTKELNMNILYTR